ncbi:hypothetical protein ACLOJK_039751 [Asimina triloba]
MAGQKGEETIVRAAGDEEQEQEQEERLLEDVVVLDFDMLCATVAMQTQGFSVGNGGKVGGGEEEGEFGGVQRMWEGEVLDCFEDRRIALETGTIYVIFVAAALLNYVAFGVTRQHSFLYLAVAFTILIGTYLGLFRTQIRKQFNITGSDSALDDCMQHIFCPCCTLCQFPSNKVLFNWSSVVAYFGVIPCQESRTLEINNVQDGVWRGRGDMICVGRHSDESKSFFELRQFTGPTLIPSKSPELFIMERETNSDTHAWNIDRSHSEPLIRKQSRIQQKRDI